MTERELRYVLKFRTPVAVFTGLGIAGLLDRTVVRDSNKKPYIPGSTVKGRLRFFAERVLRSKPDENTQNFSVHEDGKPHCKTLDSACTLCRLFGNPALTSLISVSQAWPSQEWAERFADAVRENANPVIHPDADIRPGIAISRQRRTALTDHLFQDETLPIIEFQGQLYLDARISQQEENFLVVIGQLVDSLGSRKAIGRGRLTQGILIEKTPS